MAELWTGITPRLTRCVRLSEALSDALPGLPDRILFHAGPAFATPDACPVPVLNAAIAAVLAEGWAADVAAAKAAILSGSIAMAPAQDFGLVTPLACVVSPAMPVLVIEAGGVRALSPINDGPAEGALRFGAAQPVAQVARIRQMQSLAGVLDAALGTGIALLPLMAQAISAGDDLHGSVASMSAGLAAKLNLDGPAGAYASTPLFALNPVMGAAAAMLRAVAARAPEPMIMAAGGNGIAFGWKTSDAPDRWITAQASTPVGPRMDPDGVAEVLPAIGDSAVIDALGFGGGILRHAPMLREALAPFHPPKTFAPSPAFLAAHPDLPADIQLGLSATATEHHPGIMLAMLGTMGEGLLGRGLAPWPE